jgi:hypothetical protein
MGGRNSKNESVRTTCTQAFCYLLTVELQSDGKNDGLWQVGTSFSTGKMRRTRHRQSMRGDYLIFTTLTNVCASTISCGLSHILLRFRRAW